METNISYLAVLLAGVSSMVVGFLWYGVLFKKHWMEMMGYTSESMAGMKMSANKAYLLQFVASFVMACVLAHFIRLGMLYFPDVSALKAGVHSAFWAWLGFVAPVTLGVVLWENKPWKLWLINTSNYLVSLVVMGVILSLWE